MSTVSSPNSENNLPLFYAEESTDEVHRRILIVDDEALTRNLFAGYLSDDYICTTAASIGEALAHLAIDEYALVLSELKLSCTSGVALLREIRIRYPNTAFIVMSNISETHRILDALKLGAADYLVKPCELDVLLATVDQTLARRASFIKSSY